MLQWVRYNFIVANKIVLLNNWVLEDGDAIEVVQNYRTDVNDKDTTQV